MMAMALPCCRGYVDLERINFLATLSHTIQIAIILFPAFLGIFAFRVQRQYVLLLTNGIQSP